MALGPGHGHLLCFVLVIKADWTHVVGADSKKEKVGLWPLKCHFKLNVETLHEAYIYL